MLNGATDSLSLQGLMLLAWGNPARSSVLCVVQCRANALDADMHYDIGVSRDS